MMPPWDRSDGFARAPLRSAYFQIRSGVYPHRSKGCMSSSASRAPVTGLVEVFDRVLLGVFDALLVVVLGLVLNGISARDPSSSPSWMDRIQPVAVVSAHPAQRDGARRDDRPDRGTGFYANKTAAFGLNLLLLVSLAGTAWLSIRFSPGTAPSTGSRDGRPPACPSFVFGSPRSWSSSHQCSPSPDRIHVTTPTRGDSTCAIEGPTGLS